MVTFRGTLRKAALEAKDDDTKLKLRGSILAESDALRDAPFLVERGLALVDTPDGETLVQPRVAEAAKPKPPSRSREAEVEKKPPSRSRGTKAAKPKSRS